MKRFLCVLFVLLLIATSASAITDLDAMIEGHNIYTAVCAAQTLDGEPKINNEKGFATFDLSEKLHDIFFFKNGKVTGFSCVCQDPAYEIEFLAQCVTACYNFVGLDVGDNCYEAILSQFMFARSDNPLDATFEVPGLLLGIEKKSFGYVFSLTVVK